MENINFRGIPTSLFLNGPKLGIVTDPQDQLEVVGFATFTGIATVTAGAGGTMDAGIGMGASIVFKWYLDGSEVKDINVDNYSRARILGFSSATGYGTTITFNSLVSADSGKEVYYTVDFVPTAYSQPAGTAVTVGSARSTANAINEPLQSESATVTILPIIEVTSQPSEQLVVVNEDATFSVAGRKTPGNGPVNYQWQLNGNDLSDGENQSLDVFGSGSGTFTITRGSETPVEVDATKLSSYDNFVTGEIYTIVADSDIEADLFAFGADGDTDARSGNAAAGRGGTAKGRFTFIANQTYKLIVGKVGTEDFVPELKHGGGGQSREGGDRSGGGFSGLFINEATHANSIIIAGGGGSAGKGNYRAGGNGGFLDAANNSAGWSTNSGGSQTLGGIGFYDTRDGSGTYGTLYRYMTGTALQGGYNNGGKGSNNGGNGGGGYFGGGAGRSDSNYSPGPYGGGGGSSFLHSTLITDGEVGGGTSDFDNTNSSRVAGEGGFRIEIVSVAKSASLTVSGSQTENLTLNSNAVLNSTVKCKLTATGVQESPVFSNTVSYVCSETRNVLNIETYTYSNATAKLSEFDFEQLRSSEAVCISVIDEDEGEGQPKAEMDASWKAFRAKYPKRPFWLLSPGVGSPDIKIPEGWGDDPLAYGPIEVRRDGGDPNQRSDWFTDVGLDKAPAGTQVSLLVDDSGSMTTGTVSASLGFFKKQCRENGIVINGDLDNEIVMDPIEHWIDQHNREIDDDLNKLLTIDYDTYPGNAVCIYARDKDLDVEIDMYGGAGIDPNRTAGSGGPGGYSKIRLTMKKDEEYVITGLFSAINAPFLYRKATLIAVVGAGGDASFRGGGGYGGAGGGVNVAGGDATQSGAGTGGVRIETGTLPSAGLFGSLTSLEAVDPDQNIEDTIFAGTGGDTSDIRAAGRTIPCTRGVYWRDQGKAPCEDLGTIKFRTPDGTEISNTAEIARGYKSGYNIIQTRGAGANNGGAGGAGATGGRGGNGSTNYGAGGGGSGYTDGSVTVVNTTLGGSDRANATIVIRLV